MHGEEEEVVEVRRSSRSRTRPAPAPEKEKESRSKEKSKRKHKESKREREAGDAQPAGRAHERRGGGGGDVWEDGEMLHNADAQQNTGDVASYTSFSVQACQSLSLRKESSLQLIPVCVAWLLVIVVWWAPLQLLLELPAAVALP